MSKSSPLIGEQVHHFIAKWLDAHCPPIVIVNNVIDNGSIDFLRYDTKTTH